MLVYLHNVRVLVVEAAPVELSVVHVEAAAHFTYSALVARLNASCLQMLDRRLQNDRVAFGIQRNRRVQQA